MDVKKKASVGGDHYTVTQGCHKKGWGRVPKDLATIENVIFNANQNARGLGVLFNISGRSCGCV